MTASSRRRITFLGSGAFGLPTLKHLAAHHDIAAVVSQPDRPAGRGSKDTPTPIAAWAAEHLPAVPIIKPEKISTPEVMARVRDLAGATSGPPAPTPIPPPGSPCFVVIAFGQKLPQSLLQGIFAINLHASLLPRWRGAAPINAAILAGDRVTGNSVITLADRMDAGLVLGTTERPIDPSLTAGELHDLLADDGPALVQRVLDQHLAGSLAPTTQDESLTTKAGKFAKADGWVDFTQTAERCRWRVHGLTPWPGVTVQFRNEPLKLLRVHDEPGSTKSAPGDIIDANAGLVACGSGTILRLIEVQPAGKRPMLWKDFANGRQVKPGERLIGAGAGC